MSRFQYSWWCFVFSAILGGFWGGVISLANPELGLSIGLALGFFCYVILANRYTEETQEEELPQHNRRFNDL
jgi:hypothetical protein